MEVEVVQVAVLGANGHTGRFVMAELRRRGANPIPAVRPGTILPGARRLDFDDPESLDQALRGAQAVINCAGPFLDTAEPGARAAIRAGIPYLDVTPEQITVMNLFDRLDAEARAGGVTIVPAMAFYGGLADLLATALISNHGVADRIEVGIALDSWHPTPGTRLTGERNIYPRMVVRHGELVAQAALAPTRQWRFNPPFGNQAMTGVQMAEIVLMHRHLRAAEITNYLNDKPLADLGDPATPPPVASDERGRSSQQFVVDVRVEHAGQHSRATAAGQDIYAITAPLVVSACLDLISKGGGEGGVRAPGELFDARVFLTALSPDLTTAFQPAIQTQGRQVRAMASAPTP